MKRIVLTGLICFVLTAAFAGTDADSAAYQLERKKINNMLASRALKFGQYDESLTMHTGIFGFQTKKDIRRSNDILMDIVKTDDAIYKELKILFEYNTFQKSQVQNHSKEAEQINIDFMATINKLRNHIGQLNAAQLKQEQEEQNARLWFILVFLLMFASILYLLARIKKQPL